VRWAGPTGVGCTSGGSRRRSRGLNDGWSVGSLVPLGSQLRARNHFRIDVCTAERLQGLRGSMPVACGACPASVRPRLLLAPCHRSRTVCVALSACPPPITPCHRCQSLPSPY
jgi:hypothetical protein